jgi:hypothetical protein
MQPLRTTIPYEDIKSFIRVQRLEADKFTEFTEYYSLALKEITDDVLQELVINFMHWWGSAIIFDWNVNRKHFSIEQVLTLTEYVIRVEKTLDEEHKAKIELERFKEQIRAEEWYTGIKPLADKYPEVDSKLENVLTTKALGLQLAEKGEQEDSVNTLEIAASDLDSLNAMIKRYQVQSSFVEYLYKNTFQVPSEATDYLNAIQGKHVDYIVVDDLVANKNPNKKGNKGNKK